MAATVAHELNTPLFVATGTLEFLHEEFDKDSEAYIEIECVIRNLRILKEVIKKISYIETVATQDYDGTSTIVDIEKSLAGDRTTSLRSK